MNVIRVVFRAVWSLALIIFVAANVKAAADICFEEQIAFYSGDGPFRIIAADLDGDGHDDLVAANSVEGNIAVFWNDQNGGFLQPPDAYNVDVAISVAAGYFDDDEYLDLVAVSDNRVVNNVSVFTNNGDRRFHTPPDIYTADDYPSSVSVANMNILDDDCLDIIVSNENGASVSILMNKCDGTGTFEPSVNYPAGYYPFWHCTADYNGDTFIDVAVVNHDAGNFTVLFNDGHGSLAPFIPYPVGNINDPTFITCADYDLDGDTDLAMSKMSLGGIVSVWKNDGNGVFSWFSSSQWGQ